jgi:hypothetical protein
MINNMATLYPTPLLSPHPIVSLNPSTLPVVNPITNKLEIAPLYNQPSSAITYVPTTYKYQNINNDKNLQNLETTYFLEKTIGWMKHDSSFSKVKKYLSDVRGENGYEIMHKILRMYVKQNNTNWYDLKAQKILVKQYIRHKLKQL